MSDIFQSILNLIANGEVQISAHGYEELADETAPAVLITAYRPDPLCWSDDFLRRK